MSENGGPGNEDQLGDAKAACHHSAAEYTATEVPHLTLSYIIIRLIAATVPFPDHGLMNMRTDVDEKAAGWVAKLVCAKNAAALLPALEAWLREDKSHVIAFAEAQRAWRLAEPFLQIAQSNAGSDEIAAFFAMLERDKRLLAQDLEDS